MKLACNTQASLCKHFDLDIAAISVSHPIGNLPIQRSCFRTALATLVTTESKILLSWNCSHGGQPSKSGGMLLTSQKHDGSEIVCLEMWWLSHDDMATGKGAVLNSLAGIPSPRACLEVGQITTRSQRASLDTYPKTHHPHKYLKSVVRSLSQSKCINKLYMDINHQ